MDFLKVLMYVCVGFWSKSIRLKLTKVKYHENTLRELISSKHLVSCS